MAKRARPRPFDLARYVGSAERGIHARYTPTQIEVLSAGTLGLLAAIRQSSPARAKAVAQAACDFNRRRFQRPRRA